MATKAKLQLRPPAKPKSVTGSKVPPKLAGPSSKRPEGEGLRMIGGHFPRATWVQLRKLAIDENRTTQDLLGEALSDLFAKYSR